MELYHWYKGTELPDRECDCVVIFRAYGENAPAIKGFGKCTKSKNSATYCIVDSWGLDYIHLISYMPIEFPKEVK